MSEDEYMDERNLVREDSKRAFRVAQIEGEGNDPAKSGVTYGTPHDLASMYGRRSVATPKGGEPGAIPQGYSELEPEKESEWGQPGPEGGRPTEKASVYGTNDNPMGGRDPLGVHGMHGGFPSDNENVMENLTTQAVYHKNKESLKSIVFEKETSKDPGLLNEDNIKDLGN